MSDILKSKLLSPYKGMPFVERPRLLKTLFRSQYQKATILIAPAGYGKTVSMLQLATASKKKLVWYQLDENDSDPAVFLKYLIAGLRRHFPNFGRGLLNALAQGGFNGRQRALAATIVNDLHVHAENGLVIAFDDYHLLQKTDIHGLVQDIITHLPDNVHILIASRTPLPIPLTRLMMQGSVLVAGPDELRFSREEMKGFLLENRKKVTDEMLDELEQQTRGWPAALRLICDSAADTIDNAAVDGDRNGIFDYLASEVLGCLPERIQSFLLCSSVLEELEPAFCDSLLERSDTLEILEYLQQMSLFLITLENKKTYRYHHLFRNFMQAKLGDVQRRNLLKRAGMLERENGRLNNAVEYFISAGCYEELPSTLNEAGRNALQNGQWQTVERWLAPLSDEVLDANPWLALYKAKIEVHHGRFNEAELWSNKVIAVFTDNQSQVGLAEVLLLQAHLLLLKGYSAECLGLLEEASALFPLNEADFRLDIILEKCFALIVLARYNEAESILIGALKHATEVNDGFAKASLMEKLGALSYIKGRYPEALQYYRLASEAAPGKAVLGRLNQDIVVAIYTEWGELERALEYAKRNVSQLESLNLIETLPIAYRQLGEIYADLGKKHEAEEFLSRSIHLLQDTTGDRTQLVLSLLEWAEYLALQGRWIDARATAEAALSETTQQTNLARIICWIRCSLIFLQTGSMLTARKMLAEALAMSEQTDTGAYSKALTFGYLYQAGICFQTGEMTEANHFARKGLALAGKLNCQIIFLRWYEFLKPILRYGLESGIEVTFIHRVLANLREKAAPLLRELAEHPDANVRRKVIAPFAEIAGLLGEKSFRDLLNDANTDVRHLARNAAWRLNIRLQGVTEIHEVAPPSVQFNALGHFRLLVEGTATDKTSWRTEKTRDLLAYLVHCGEAVSLNKILDNLWPDYDPDSASGLFHTTLYYVRRLLEDLGQKNFVSYSGKQYKLSTGSFVTDVGQFQSLTAAGKRMDAPPAETANYLEQALALYKGDYLEELDYPWVIPVQENLRRSCIGARIHLAKHYLGAKQYSPAIDHLQIAEKMEPFDEQIHTLLMTVFAGQGNFVAVKRQFMKMETDFRKELALSPSLAVRNLYSTLMK